jgi:hypothetical protein
MNIVEITSYLKPRERKRLYRYEKRMIKYETNWPFPVHIGRNKWASSKEGMNAHDIARRMMAVCGVCFEYKVILSPKNRFLQDRR